MRDKTATFIGHKDCYGVQEEVVRSYIIVFTGNGFMGLVTAFVLALPIAQEQLCFQAFSALAYGASAISWACYSAGWWHNHVLDADGNKTFQYEKLKKVNHKLRFLAAEYIKYQWVSTERISSGSTTKFETLKSIVSSQDALLGKFEKTDGTKALFFYPLDVQASADSTLRFKLDEGKQAYLYKLNSKKVLVVDADGVYRITLYGSEACFITVN